MHHLAVGRSDAAWPGGGRAFCRDQVTGLQGPIDQTPQTATDKPMAIILAGPKGSGHLTRGRNARADEKGAAPSGTVDGVGSPRTVRGGGVGPAIGAMTTRAVAQDGSLCPGCDGGENGLCRQHRLSHGQVRRNGTGESKTRPPQQREPEQSVKRPKNPLRSPWGALEGFRHPSLAARAFCASHGL